MVFEVAYSGFSEEVDDTRFGVADVFDTQEHIASLNVRHLSRKTQKWLC